MYETYTDKDLIDAYNSMLEYSGEPSKDMKNAIELRGGMDWFKRKIESENRLKQETDRISKEVYSLVSPETNIEFITKVIKSDILTTDQLNELIEKKYNLYQNVVNNRRITQKTIAGCIIGIITGLLCGGFALQFLFKESMVLAFFCLILIYLFSYLIIWLLTKQRRSNWLVFLSCFLATVGAFILGLYLLGVF